MTTTERREVSHAVLALENLVNQLVALSEGFKPVPGANVQGVAYLLGLTTERLGRVAGNGPVEEQPE